MKKFLAREILDGTDTPAGEYTVKIVKICEQ